MTAGLTRSPAVKGIAMTLWTCQWANRTSPDVCSRGAVA